MQFHMWSAWHILYMLSPFLIMIPLYYLLRKKSEKTIYIVGVVIGSISLAIILTRIIYYYATHGFHPQEIPLQVCHFGNIIVFIALVFKSKTAGSVAWGLNMVAAYSSIILADSLEKYETVWAVLPQCYIWGHLLIVLGAMYPIVMKEIRLTWKSYGYGMLTIVCLLIPAIILNSYFNDKVAVEHPDWNWFINYFYIYNSKGVPFKDIYNAGVRVQYGEWFTINWVYTLSLVGMFAPTVTGIHALSNLFHLKNKGFETHNIFYKESILEPRPIENK